MRVLITGGSGLVGQSLINYFGKKQDLEICAPTRSELDYFNFQAILDFFETWKPDCVVHLAAKVGGITANNNFPGKFKNKNSFIDINKMINGFKRIILSDTIKNSIINIHGKYKK